MKSRFKKLISSKRPKLLETNPQHPSIPLVDTNDRAVSAVDSWNRTDYLTFNPDTLARKRGLDVYDNMLTDPQVYAISEIKKLAVLSSGWIVAPASHSNTDIAVADFVRWSLVRVPGAFTETLFSILTSMDYGFSITEKIWYVIDDNRKFKGMVGIRDLKPKAPHTFDFKMDKYGNVLPLGLIQMLNDEEHNLPYRKFLHMPYNSRFDNPYGRSDLRAAYRPYIEKMIITRFWNIFLERFGSPIVVTKIPSSATDEEIADVKMVTRTIQSKSSLTIPEGFDLDTLEARRTGSGNYEVAVSSKNMDISRSILMPDLMGFSDGVRPGSFALGKMHGDLFNMIVETVSRWVETLINEQLVRELVDFNFTVNDYPRFRFDPIKRENRSVRAKLVAIMIDAGIVHPFESWIREFVELPEMTNAGAGKNEESQDDPILGAKLAEIKRILALPHPKLEDPITDQKVGANPQMPLSITPRPGRSLVEVQEVKVGL